MPKEAEERELAKKKEEQQKQRQANRQRSSKKLSYKLQLELDELPAKIEQLENDIAELQEKINDPGFFADVKNDTQAVLTLLAEKEQAFEVAFERWEELEAMQKES